MKGTRRFRLALVLGLVILACALPAAAQLEKVLEQRNRANAEAIASQRRIDELADETEELVRRYRAVLEQIDSLRVYNRQLQALIADQKREMASLREQIDRVQLVGRSMTPLMLDMIEALEQFVRLDVPFLPEERARRLARLRELMTRSDVSDSERYRRILEAYQIENEYGRTIEAYRGTMELDGQERTVDFLRIGRIALIYQTLDGERAGVWDQSSRQWIALPASYRGAIREGLRIARKQAAPDLIEVPVPAPAPVEAQ
ncbi:MAG: DUF3450 domain-containing protein [Candidatus Dadabacteria bacterium]|nr:MAG: DUF3450 domain-containing protein [Candidatus Dadabacteria bacterium]